MGIAIVTGATAGIGRLVSDRLVSEGRTVVGVARRRAILDDLSEASLDQPGEFVGLSIDLSVPGSATEVYERATAFGDVEVIVNVAGYGGPAPVEACADEFLRPMFETNFFTPYSLIRSALPGMRERGAGTIVNVLSVCSVLSVPGLSAYCSTKFALYALSESLRQEVEPLGIRVIGVLPGFTKTDAWLRSREIYETLGQHDGYERVEAVSILDEVAMRIGVRPEAVAETVVRAISDPKSGDHHVIGLDGHLVNMWAALPGPLRRKTMNAATGFLGWLKKTK